MRRPYDLMALLKQEQRAVMLENLKEELLARKEEIDRNEDKDTGTVLLVFQGGGVSSKIRSTSNSNNTRAKALVPKVTNTDTIKRDHYVDQYYKGGKQRL